MGYEIHEHLALADAWKTVPDVGVCCATCISLVVTVAVLMPLGVFLTKACGGTCCGLFSCCGLTYLTVLAMKISWFFFKLPFRICCCVRKFERDRQVRSLHSSCHSCLKLLQQALAAACIGIKLPALYMSISPKSFIYHFCFFSKLCGRQTSPCHNRIRKDCMPKF